MNPPEYVELFDIGCEWAPNAPYALLLQDDFAHALLVLNPHFNDHDQENAVMFAFKDCRCAIKGEPNDEARSGHPLYAKELADILWAGIVRNSSWIDRLEKQNSVHPYHNPARYQALNHYILVLKEDTFECIAESVSLIRQPRVKAIEVLNSLRTTGN